MGAHRIASLVLLVLNLTACISCLIVSVLVLVHGSIMIVDPSPCIVAAEVVLASTTIALNVWEVTR